MHIIVLEQEPSSRRGGQEVVLFDFCCGLARHGHRIDLLYNQEGDLLDRYREFCTATVKIKRFTVYRKPYIFSFIAELWQTIWQIPSGKDSIVLSNQYQDSLFGCILAFTKNLPFVCYLHIPPPKVLPRTFVERQWSWGLKGVKHAIAVSAKTKLDWVNNGFKAEKIDVVHNGINVEAYNLEDLAVVRKKWHISEDIRVVSYIGRIDKEKGLETLLKAFALLLKTDDNIRLLIAGKPLLQGEEYKKELDQVVIDLGMEKHVSFLGHVTDTASVYQLSDVTVLPSLWSEPFGRTIIESMACGTPVVASRTGGIPEILTGEFQCGLFEPGDERGLSDTLNQIIHWRGRDPQLGQRCRKHVLAKFTSDKMVDGVERVLLRIFER